MPATGHPAERRRETASTESKAPSGTPTIHATPPASPMVAGRSSGRSARSAATFVLAALVLIVALGTWFIAHEDRSASAGSTDTAVTEAPASESPGSPSNESPSQASDGGTKRAHVGGAITLNGIQDGLTMDVTVVKVVDPAKPTHSVFGRKQGNHIVAIRIELINSGTKMYSDTSSTAAALIDDKLHRYDAYDADFTGLVGPGFGSPKIAPGDKRAGSITFEVPDGTTPMIFQFSLDSGFGPDTGLWSL